MKTPGIHHITALAGEPRRNLEFYTGVLGLRLVKKTVNYDDPGTYHLYYGVDAGSPGTILTFFPWPGAPPGRPGPGQVIATALSIPEGALEAWQRRLADAGIEAGPPAERFDQPFLSFADPDGLRLELVESPRDPRAVDAADAIRGFHSAALAVHEVGESADLLEAMGLRRVGEEGGRLRFVTTDADAGGTVDLVHRPGDPRGRVAVGTVHHIAWRALDEQTQRAWREDLVSRGLQVTPVLDRRYFRSIYFREPSGILFEIATDPPGFAADEAPDRLGTELKLPPWLEPQRDRIESALPPLD